MSCTNANVLTQINFISERSQIQKNTLSLLISFLQSSNSGKVNLWYVRTVVKFVMKNSPGLTNNCKLNFHKTSYQMTTMSRYAHSYVNLSRHVCSIILLYKSCVFLIHINYFLELLQRLYAIFMLLFLTLLKN